MVDGDRLHVVDALHVLAPFARILRESRLNRRVADKRVRSACAAISRRFVFSEDYLGNCRLAKSLVKGANFASRMRKPATKTAKCSHFAVNVPRKKRITPALKLKSVERGRDRGRA
jgi:hypothetical protein